MAGQSKVKDVMDYMSAYVLDYADKTPIQSDAKWLSIQFAKSKDVWKSDKERTSVGAAIAETVSAYEDERAEVAACRARGESHEKYLLGRLESGVANLSKEDAERHVQQLSDGMLDGLRQVVGFNGEKSCRAGQVPDWNGENRGLVAKSLVNIASAGGAMRLVDLAQQACSTPVTASVSDGASDKKLVSVVEKAIDDRKSTSLSVPIAGAVATAAKKGLLGEAMKKAPTEAIALSSCVAVDGAKALVDLGKGKITLAEAADRVTGSACAATGAYFARNVGGKVGGAVGGFVGGIFGPVGSAVGKMVGQVVGKFFGEKVGGAVGRVVHAGAKIVGGVASGICHVASGIVSGVGHVIGGAVSFVGGLLGF